MERQRLTASAAFLVFMIISNYEQSINEKKTNCIRNVKNHKSLGSKKFFSCAQYDDKLEFVGQIFTAPLPPAFMREVPEGRGEYRTRMRKSFYLRRFTLILG